VIIAQTFGRVTSIGEGGTAPVEGGSPIDTIAETRGEQIRRKTSGACGAAPRSRGDDGQEIKVPT